jgi:hypothetical protein
VRARALSRRSAALLLTLSFALGASACGPGAAAGRFQTDGPGAVVDAGATDVVVIAGSGPYYPLGVGDNWTYQVTATDGTVSTEVVSVTAEETVGGSGPYAAQPAFRVVTGSAVDDPNGDRDWEAVVDSRAVRYREVTISETKGNAKNEAVWDPPRLRVDETDAHTAMSASWTEPTYTEYDTSVDTGADGGFVQKGTTTTQTEDDLWSVIGISEVVTVPAGAFATLHVKRINTDVASGIKELWFARGVGLVQETGAGQPTHVLTAYQVAPADAGSDAAN